MTALNADPRQSRATSPPAGVRSARRVRADRAAAVAGSARRWPLSRIIGVALLVLLLFSLATVAVGGWARGRVYVGHTTPGGPRTAYAHRPHLPAFHVASGLPAGASQPLGP